MNEAWIKVTHLDFELDTVVSQLVVQDQAFQRYENYVTADGREIELDMTSTIHYQGHPAIK
jgi:hypothetical protein